MGLFRALTIGLFILAVPLALITTNIRLAVSETAVYDYSVRTYDAAAVSGIPEDELLRANGRIQRYLTHDDAGPLAIQVRDSAGRTAPLFSAKETVHMADVRNLVQALFAAQVASVALLMTLAVVMLVLWPPRALAAAALCGSLLTAALLGATGLLAVSGFDAAWGKFHVIAFSNDFWRLDPDTDHLIQMFPEAFWQKATTAIGAFTMLEALLLGSLSLAYLAFSRPEKPVAIVRPAPALPGPAGHARPRMAPPDPHHLVR
ncbi:MAG: TIGR01906 family membrane protein [Dehalococcoidia bacterium]|nr:TIGR01906 family membrane protein [Dehalococcoidia bacterium]